MDTDDIVIEPAEPVEHMVTAASNDYELDGTRVTGKLFLRGYGSDSYCSASVVNSDSKRMIATAGHCLHGGAGSDWFTDMVFVPRYDGTADDPTPVGVWQVATMRTFAVWAREGGPILNSTTEEAYARDIGFASLYKGGDGVLSKIVHSVGANGIHYNRDDAWPATIAGYPSNLDDGEVAQSCSMWTVEDQQWWYRFVNLCDFYPGSSGGPWYNALGTNGLGYIRGVTSTHNPGYGRNGAARFDTGVYDLHKGESAKWEG